MDVLFLILICSTALVLGNEFSIAVFLEQSSNDQTQLDSQSWFAHCLQRPRHRRIRFLSSFDGRIPREPGSPQEPARPCVQRRAQSSTPVVVFRIPEKAGRNVPHTWVMKTPLLRACNANLQEPTASIRFGALSRISKHPNYR